jgi:hypothetical protein
MARNSEHPFWRTYSVEVWIVTMGLIAMNLIFLADTYWGTTVSAETAGQLGDFVGGYVGAFFSLVGVVLLFTTLKNQRQASERQFFESKYFELIKLHRDNVAELELKEARGRKLFVLMIREFRCVLAVVREVAEDLKMELTRKEEFHITYYCLYFGVGPNSSRILLRSLPQFPQDLVGAIEARLNNADEKKRVQEERSFGYVPFEGHQSRLGHYYRHLYQMTRYVDLATHLGEGEKYEYVKTIRAQLSTHEQVMLLINSLTPMGNDWWGKNLIVPYRLVQNIPKDFFHSKDEIDLTSLFEPGYFEWQDTLGDSVLKENSSSARSVQKR